jgi:inner membrane protein YidH
MQQPSCEGRRPNGGSASDHLANERTFLAWIRTAIGIFLVAFGSLLNLMAFIRYRIIDKQIKDADYKPNNLLTTLLIAFILLAGISLVWYLVSSTQG